jgi:hypothetical protein
MVVHLFVFMLVVFMSGQEPQVLSKIAPSLEVCRAAAAQIQAKLKAEPDPTVTAVAIGCVPVDMQLPPAEPVTEKGSI